MNRRTKGLTISHAIYGFVKDKVVDGLSERTLECYSDHLSPFTGHIGDLSMAEITVMPTLCHLPAYAAIGPLNKLASASRTSANA